MATTLYLRSALAPISRGTNTANQRGTNSNWRSRALSTATGSGAGTSVAVSSAAGPVAGVELGIPLAEWISEPLAADVTISSTMTFLFNGSETSTMANGSASYLVQRLDSTGAIASTVVTASHGTELSSSAGSSPSAHSFTATPTSTAFTKGDRIRIVPFVDDNATTGNMASGYTFTLNFDGDAANTADSYVQFTENLTWMNNNVTETKLVASDKAANDQFGYSVACSSDGSVVISGSRLANPGGTADAGAVYVYSGTNYATETKLFASDKAANDQFGFSVACSSDGSVVVVGAPFSDPGGTSAAGAVYVYSGSSWATEKKLVASDKSASADLGYSVACSSDGSVVVVGAFGASVGGTSTGAVYVYSGTNYATETKLFASDRAATDFFGYSVACSSDASVVVVGARGSDPGGTAEAGAAYVYSGTNYATETKLVASDKSANANFGGYAACSSDGSVVAVGRFSGDGVYTYSGSSWGTEKKFTDGRAVALSSDGSVVVTSGAAGVVYTYSPEARRVAAADLSFFEYAVACSSDASVVVAGAPSNDPGGTADAGAAYVLGLTGTNYYLTATASDIADQGTDEKKVWTSR